MFLCTIAVLLILTSSVSKFVQAEPVTHQVRSSSKADHLVVPDQAVNLTVIQKWNYLEDELRKVSSQLVHEKLFPLFRSLMQQVNVSSLCKFSLEKLLVDLSTLERWATQVVDSSAKLPFTGLMEGSVSHLGRYDECLKTKHSIKEDDFNQETLIRGQYCSFIIRPPLPDRPKFGTICNKIDQLLNISSSEKMIGWLGQNAHYFYYVPIRMGLCTPSTCTPNELQRIVGKILADIYIDSHLVGNTCDIKSDITANSIQIFIIILLGGYGILVMVATLVDINQQHLIKGLAPFMGNHLKEDLSNGSAPSLSSSSHSIKLSPSPQTEEQPLGWRILKCFSIRRNASNLLKMKQGSESQDSLNHIHGIRVLTMAWIILGHTFGLVNHSNYSQSFQSEQLYTGFVFQGLLNATVCVDTFFFLSGLLAVYVTWKKIQTRRRINPIAYTLVRYIRLTPPYLFAIGLGVIFPLLGSGPLWKETSLPVSEACYSTWWTNLLYVNNFIKTEKICLMHSWYLSNDFQFHIIGLAVMALMIRSTWMGFGFVAFLMTSSTLVSAILAAINNYPPTIVSTSPATEERWNFILNYYYKPWPHLSSYCIGIIFGCLLASKKKFKLSTFQAIIIVTLSLLSTFLALWGVYPWNIGHPVNPILGSLYAATFRTFWSANVGLLVFYLASHRKGIVYKCLAWKGIIPLSRLTYMAYLLHPFVIWYHYGSIREPLTGTGYPMLHNFLAFYSFTYILAFIAGLLFESPFISLVKIILSSSSSKAVQLRDSQQYLEKSVNKISLVS